MLECDDFADLMAFTGGLFEGMVHPDDRARVFDEFDRQIKDEDKDGRTKAFNDYRIITKTGRIKFIADNSRQVAMKDLGNVVYVLLVDKEERVNKQQA